MNYNKKLIYRRIITLQAFRSAWNCLVVLHCCKDYAKCPDKIYEVTKHYVSDSGVRHSEISFILSNEGVPQVLDLGLFDINISLLKEPDIKRYIAECNEFGMNCPKYPKNENK